MAGAHDPGARLRQEEVASELGVSTTPVREAFRDLLAEGLIELDAHRGVLVRGLTLADVRELYEMRIVLEPILAVRAITSATSIHLEGAEEIHRRLCGEQDPQRWAALNLVFHRELTAAAPDGRLSRMVESLATSAGAYVTLSMHLTPELMAVNNDDHAALLQYSRDRNLDAVARRTADHLAQTLRAIEDDMKTRSV
jgi:DNA-binding GntR family transcriptional regulator